MEVEKFLRLLELEARYEKLLIGGMHCTTDELQKLRTQIDVLKSDLDPDSDFARFLAESRESNDDPFDPM